MSIATASLLARALDDSVPDAGDQMGERILDAALHLVAVAGLRHLTMDDVAARAGVGRMTVYRRFSTRQELVDALALREARRCLLQIAAAVDLTAPLHDRLADVFARTIRVIREHPLLARLAHVEPEALLRELTRNDSEVFGLVRRFLIEQVREAQSAGELAATDPEALAELALRLAVSFVLIPDSVLAVEDEARTRERVRALVAPLLRADLAPAAD